MKYDDYVSSIESVFLDQLKKSVIRVIVAKLPFLGLAALNPVLSMIVSKIVDKAAKEVELRVYFQFCDMRTNQQAREYSDLAIKYNQERTPENEKLMLDAFYKLASLSR